MSLANQATSENPVQTITDEKCSLVNLCGHPIHVMDPNTQQIITIAPEKLVARVENTQKVVGKINGIEVVDNRFGAIYNLPDPKEGVKYITSLVVQQVNATNANPRTDLVGPDMSAAGRINHPDGSIKCVKRLTRW